MKVNVGLEITDEQRTLLANLVDGKSSKRMITRAEVVAICETAIDKMLYRAEHKGEPVPTNVSHAEQPKIKWLLFPNDDY